MLIRFWVENYRCFRGRAKLDFTDKKNYRFGKMYVRGDLLGKIVLIGNNGSGKSSFGYALCDIITTLTGLDNNVGQKDPDCFINGYGTSDRAVFHYEFAFGGSTAVYEYSRRSPSLLASEKYSVNGKTVFDYDLDDMSGSSFSLASIGAGNVSAEGLDGSEALLKRVLDRSAVGNDVTEGIRETARTSMYYMAMWKHDFHLGLTDTENDNEEYIISNGLVGDFRSFLRDVCAIDTDMVSDGGKLYVIKGSKKLPFFETASRGTALICRLYCWWKRSRGRGGFVFLDDFDDLFDYRTSENFIERIIAGNKTQCIFVTHNPEIIAGDDVRPDCCFLLKDGELRSLASLTDKSIRRGNNLLKMLREGEFDRS